jgi:hypothetical protein
MTPRKKFKSPNKEIRRVMHPSGIHSALVGPDWVVLPEHLWIPAYSVGCISEDMLSRGLTEEQGVALLKAEKTKFEEAVEEAIKELLAEGDPDKFDRNSRPRLQVISKIVGKPVPAYLRDRIIFKLGVGKRLNV